MVYFRHLLAVLLFCSVLGSRPQLAEAIGTVLLPVQEVQSAVDQYVQQKLAGKDWSYSVRQIALPYSVKVSPGNRDIELIVPPAWEGWGSVNLNALVRVNGIVEKNLSVRVHVDAQADLVVAARQLPAGTVLSADDLQMLKMDLAQAAGYPVTSMQDAVGKKVRIALRSGAVVKSNQLVAVPVVVSGQLVTIVAESGGLRITIAGRAKSSGGTGDLVRVQNLSSGKELPARVVDASTVEVGF